MRCSVSWGRSPRRHKADLERAAIARRSKAPAIELGGNRNGRVWVVVSQIPDGRVATYGQIAALAGIAGRSAARQVGYALAALQPATDVPWHRVVNARGELSPRANPDAVAVQRMLLEEEGIGFDHRRCIDLIRYAWQPES